MKTFNYSRLFLLCSIIFLSYFQIGSSYTITGNVLTDLTATDADFFNQASTWTASNYATAGVVVSMCDDTFLVGGYNVLGPAGANQNGNYFEQTYTSLPTHNNMYFSIRLWMIDGWDIWSDYVQIYFDNNQYGTFYFRKEDAVTPNICGATAKNEIPGATLEGQLPHSSASLNLRFYMRTSKDSMSASFGFRDIKLTFDTIYPPATGITYCTRSPTYLYYGTRCTCKTTQFESPSNSGSCVNCDATCATCYGSAATNCYSCYPGTYFSNYRCLTCDGSCKTCSASGTSSCTACAPGKFLTNTPTGACSSCDSTCTTCTGTATTCTSCPAGRYQSGNTCPQCHTSCATCTGDKAYQCVTCPTGSYLANNNTCITSCDSPFIKTTDGTINFCESPCTNLANFAYWDKSCQTTCAFPLSPLTLGPFKYCNYTCATSEYLYWNGTCGSRCPLPWKIDVKFVRNFCTFPCSTTQFLFANGTCANSCPYPLVTRPGETGQKYCDYPCSSTEYLLWNQTCATSCASPYQIKISGDIRYCNYPCDTTQYYYWNGSCYSKACAAPLTLRTEGGTTPSNIRNFCDLNCAKNQYMLWNGSCSNSCNSPLRAVESNGLRYCKAPCDDAYPFYFEDLAACGQSCTSPRYVEQEANYNYSLCIKPAVEDKGGSLTYFMLNAPQVNEYSLVVPTAGMGYLRFLNVNLPSRLEKLAGSQGKFLFTPRFGLSAPDSLKASFSRLLMDEVLERNGMHKSFILNFWDGLLTLAIVLGITLVLTILENVLQKSKGFLKGIHGVVERLMVMGGFNYVILVYASSIGEIVTYTYIEVTNYTSISASLIIGVLMTILIIPFFVGIVIVMKRAVKFNAYTLKNETADKYKKFAIKWRACQIFIRGMKHDHVLSRLFFLIYTVRINIQMIIGVFLMSIPIASSVIQIVINVAMIVFMLWKRPLQKKVNIVQILVFEAITLLLNICVFIVVVVCSSGTCEDGIAVIIGDVIVIGSDILNILVIVFLAIKIAIEANSIRNFLKEYPTHSKAVWTNLVSVLAQQTGMGFEECIEESSIPESSNKYIGLVLRTNTMIAREQAELLRSKSRSQIFPEDMEKRAINDTEPMIRKTDISNPMIAVNSTVLTNTADMTQIPPQSPPKLKARVKNVINNLSLKKSGTGAESHLNPLNGSPTFSIDLSDNSPAIPEVGLQEGPLLLKQAPSIESPSPIPRPSEGNNVFFPNDNIFQSSRPVSNYDDKRLLNITPIVATDTLTLDSSIDKKPTKVADEVGLDDYLKQFGLLSDDQNKASATANRKNLNRSPTLKSKKK